MQVLVNPTVVTQIVSTTHETGKLFDGIFDLLDKQGERVGFVALDPWFQTKHVHIAAKLVGQEGYIKADSYNKDDSNLTMDDVIAAVEYCLADLNIAVDWSNITLELNIDNA